MGCLLVGLECLVIVQLAFGCVFNVHRYLFVVSQLFSGKYTQVAVNEKNLTSIRKFEPEIKNRCTQVAVNRENLASIPKFGPEIKNRCTKEGVNEEKLASILKSGHEIKNQCTQQATFSTRSLDESLWR